LPIQSDPSGLSRGAIGGIVGGILGSLLVVISVVVYYLLKNRRRATAIPPIHNMGDPLGEGSQTVAGVETDKSQASLEDEPLGGRLDSSNEPLDSGRLEQSI
jgi:hypothetical protein